MFRSGFAIIIVLCVGILSGCIGGRVMVATEFGVAPLEGATVLIRECPSCTPISVTTASNGTYVYDAYDSNGDLVNPVLPIGEDAVLVEVLPLLGPRTFSFPSGDQTFYFGISGAHAYHNVNRQINTDSEGRMYSIVRDIYVTPIFPLPLPIFDQDSDGLHRDVELAIGTSDNHQDTDLDGLFDGAEWVGYNWIDYEAYGASPLARDVLIEADYHTITRPSADMIHKARAYYRSAFDRLANPDGTSGINLIFALDSVLPATTNCRGTYRNSPWRNSRKATGFHYGMFCGTGFSGQAQALSDGRPTTARAFHVNTSAFNSNPDDDMTEGSVFFQYALGLHELGHTLGVRHGGATGAERNCKPQYKSMMNYSYDYQVAESPHTLASTLIGYSEKDVGQINENFVSEIVPFPGNSIFDLFFLEEYDDYGIGGGYPIQVSQIVSSETDVDFNRDGLYEFGYERMLRDGASCPASGIPLDTVLRTYSGHDDIDRIRQRLDNSVPEMSVSADPGLQEVSASLSLPGLPEGREEWSSTEEGTSLSCGVVDEPPAPAANSIKRRPQVLNSYLEDGLASVVGIRGANLAKLLREIDVDMNDEEDRELFGGIRANHFAPISRRLFPSNSDSEVDQRELDVAIGDALTNLLQRKITVSRTHCELPRKKASRIVNSIRKNRTDQQSIRGSKNRYSLANIPDTLVLCN